MAGDPRILVLEGDFPRADMLELIAACDCFVSLHRSEGFGRVLAEALSLGRPVVATYWSGNVDFADLGQQYLVEGALVPLQPGDYPTGDGQHWAEPDFEASVAALRAAREDCFRGPQEVAERFRPETVGARYARRLALYGVSGSPPRSQSALT
jgi:glycosyltransferase involved in cell wall biosynthesis